MKSINNLRREEQIKQLISSILINDFVNSNVYNPTVIDCDLSNDLSLLKVYVTFTEKSQKGLETLNNSKNYIKKIISKSINWRKTPDIVFILDNVTNEGMKIDSILESIKNENNAIDNKLDFDIQKLPYGFCFKYKINNPYLKINLWTIDTTSDFFLNEYKKNQPIYYLCNSNEQTKIRLANSEKILERNFSKKTWFTHDSNAAFQIMPGEKPIKFIELKFEKKEIKIVDQYEIKYSGKIPTTTSLKLKKNKNIKTIDTHSFIVREHFDIEKPTKIDNCYVFDLSTENLYFYKKPKTIYFHNFITLEKK